MTVASGVSFCFASVSGKVHTARELTQALPKELQHDNQAKPNRDDRSLDTQRILRPHGRRPRDLVVRDDEAAEGAAEVDPGGNLAGCLGVGVQQVGVDGRGADDDTIDEEAPCHGGHHVVPAVLQGDAEQDDAEDHEGRGEEDGDEADLGLETALVAPPVYLGDEVEDEMACDLS